MKTLTVADFKTKFSDVVESLKQGESFTVSYGQKKTKIAVIVPYGTYTSNTTRRLGVLEHKASYRMKSDFSMTDDELLTA